MAPISDIFRREDASANSSVAFYLLITSTVLFVTGVLSIISLCILRRIRRTKKAKRLVADAQNQAIYNEKAAFLDDESRSQRDSVPAIHLTFPEDHIVQGNRQSRVVVVTIGDSGSVGYAPYQEPLPVHQQKESPRFQSLDLERIGGLREDTIGKAN